MKKFAVISPIVLVCFIVSNAMAASSLYKQKKYFGPIPQNSFNISIGFIDGPNADYLNEYLANLAVTGNLEFGGNVGGGGEYFYDDIKTVPYVSLGYERMISPLHFLRATLSFVYLKSEGYGNYNTGNPITYLDVERTFKVYYLSLDLGFAYYLAEPKVHTLVPYVSGGFSSVFPMVRLETSLALEDGSPYDSPELDISQNSFEPGIHMEFGIKYFITNRYAAGMEGRYQISQSKFKVHTPYFNNTSLDIDYSGLSLSINLYYNF